MLLSNIERMRRLALDSMSTSMASHNRGQAEDSPELDYESDIDTSIDFDESTGTATFPSGMRYSVHGLDMGTRDAVIKALGPSSKLTLRGCSPRGQEYVFLVSETIDYHVRAPCGNDPYRSIYDGPSCSCQQDERSIGLQQHPCRHTLWLCDQVLSQMVPLPEDSYTWAIDGYTVEHGNVCDYISDYHLDVLADSLRCDIMTGETLKTRPRRIQTAREILATLSGTPVDQYRPDLTGRNVGKRVVKEGDLEETIFRMLLQNDSLLSYFLESMRNHEPLNPRFRRFRDRADAALEAFDNYIKASDLQKAGISKNPQWCRTTFKNISDQIKSMITQSKRELDECDGRAAANTLLYILDQVVCRNEDHDDVVRTGGGRGGHNEGQSNHSKKINLFNDLIVESEDNFILDVLDKLQVEFVDHLFPDLRRIQRTIANTNVPQSYLDKLTDIISNLRVASSRSGSEPATSSRKRTSEDNDRYPKRVR
ncbi:hypothetical protein GGR50DRAFT_681098 [Xylaria sp. CBS 124048]|nr:hypothetical protein GGR50DRAFT_681098 [Xylaria sp. CBS 124048]